MENQFLKEHWERVYETRKLDEVSWYRPVPHTSLCLVNTFKLPKNVRIIDVGGGDSLFVDYLLREGFNNITVLDISEKALERAKMRLGDKASKVKWIVSDVVQFTSSMQYDLWHDRAVFHFLTSDEDVKKYVDNLQRFVIPGGYLVLGTFSEKGPEMCSGLKVRRYSEKSMTDCLKGFFKKIKCITEDHMTPAKKIQNFIFCSFQRRKAA